MKTSLRLKVAFAVCAVWSVIATGFLIRAEWQIHGVGGWQNEVFALTGMVASNRAAHDFSDGKVRLLKLDGERNDWRYTGENDGPFEVWNPQFDPSLGVAHRYSTEQYVRFYNQAMKSVYEQPERLERKVEP